MTNTIELQQSTKSETVWPTFSCLILWSSDRTLLTAPTHWTPTTKRAKAQCLRPTPVRLWALVILKHARMGPKSLPLCLELCRLPENQLSHSLSCILAMHKRLRLASAGSAQSCYTIVSHYSYKLLWPVCKHKLCSISQHCSRQFGSDVTLLCWTARLPHDRCLVLCMFANLSSVTKQV